MLEEYEPIVEVTRLFEALNNKGLRYCHWKSNNQLDKSLSAWTDLDLLVDPDQQARFTEILRNLNIKRFLPPADRDYPGIEHWIGFDPCSGRLFHLHVHYQLALGQHLLKNYHLPLEQHYFNSTRMLMGVKVPQVELDLIVLCIRAMLKYRDRDALRDVLKFGPPGLTEHIKEEINWLLSQTSRQQVAQALEALDESLPAAAVLEFLEVIARSPRDGWRLLKIRRQISQAVAGYSRYTLIQATLIFMWKGIRQRIFLKSGLPIGRMKPENGGRRLAFVGLDGAGKSSMLQQAFTWLSGRARTRRCYLGNAEPSWLTLALARLTRASNLVARSVQRVSRQGSLLARAASQTRWLLEQVELVSVGRDRWRRYQRSLAEAAQGTIVLYDRYPLEPIQFNGRMIDGPKIAYQAQGRFSRRLAALEEAYYRRIHPPDKVIALLVTPEVAVARKPEHDYHILEAKSRSYRQGAAALPMATLVDADQPFEKVLLEIKTAIWNTL